MQISFTLTLLVGAVAVSILSLQGSAWFAGHSNDPQPPSDDPGEGALHGVDRVRQNFAAEINDFLNKNVIARSLHASHSYMQMAAYFDRADVALPGFSSYFEKLSERERENADDLMEYLNKRGGMVQLWDIAAPTASRWSDGIDAMNYVLNIEREINQGFLDLHQLAVTNSDPHLQWLLEEKYLDQKVETIKQVGDHLTNLERMRGESYGLGEYVFDKELS